MGFIEQWLKFLACSYPMYELLGYQSAAFWLLLTKLLAPSMQFGIYIEQLHTWWVHWVQILGLCQGHVWASSGVLETPKILEQSEITLWIYKFMTQQLILWCLYGWSKSGLTTDISLPMLHIKVPIYSLRKLDNINSVNISGHLLWLAAD